MRHVWLLRVTLACCVAATLPISAHAQETASAYRTSIEQAVREFSLGNYAEARALFRRAHGLSPNARTLRGMGMAAFELKLYVDALRELKSALENKVRPLTEQQRVQVQQLVDQARAFVGRYQIVLVPAEATLAVDSAPTELDAGNILLLGLGDHVISASAAGYQEVRVPVHVDGSEDIVLRVVLARDDTEAAAAAAPPHPTQPPSPTAEVSAEVLPSQAAHAALQPSAAGSGLRTAAFITAGGAVLLAGAATLTWIIGSNRYASLRSSCSPTCSESELSPVKRADLVTNVFVGTAIAAAGAAAVLFVFDVRGSAEPASETVLISPQGVALRGRF